MFSNVLSSKFGTAVKDLFRPSIWLGMFRKPDEFFSRISDASFSVYAQYPDRISPKPHTIAAYCSVCDAIRNLEVKWRYVNGSPDGFMDLPWSETIICPECGMNSRMRGMFSFVRDVVGCGADAEMYIAEQLTTSYTQYRKHFPKVVGSEFVSADARPGSVQNVRGVPVRHEDMTKLSFAEKSFDVIISQNVFEHIPDYKAAFKEAARVLVSGTEFAGGGVGNSSLTFRSIGQPGTVFGGRS